jgi:hypothetical protein
MQDLAVEDPYGLSKTDAMFVEIGRGFAFVPAIAHRVSIYNW